MGRVRSRKRRVRDDDFIVGSGRMWSDVVGLSSNRLSIGGSIQGVSAEILSFKISWQAQCLVRLDGDFTASTHWKWGCICDADHWWVAFCVAGAVFGEVAGCLCLLRALEMRLHMWRRSLMTCILRGRRSIWWGCRVSLLSPRSGNEVAYVTQIIDDLHLAWQAQYLVRLQAAFACSAHWKWRLICVAHHWWHSFSNGRRSIWWGWRVTSLASRIGNDVWYVWQITADIHFVWQAPQLVKLQAASCRCAHWKWRFICDADHWWVAFCEAGALFGEVAGCLSLLPALEMTFRT